MNKKTFFAGLLSGVVLAYNWKAITKGGIKMGILAGRKVKEVSQQALEDIEDIAAEAKTEVSDEDRAASKGDAAG